MNRTDKIRLFEEMIDLEPGTLSEDTKLADIDQYDSMSKLALIVLFDDEFGKKLTGADIRSFVTVADVVNFME